MIAKAGLGLVGLGAIGIGGVAFAKPEWLGISKETPWTSLAKDHNYDSKKTSDYTNTNFGGKYKYYLVGVVGTNKETTVENTNKAMWDELFKKWDTDFKDPAKKGNLGNKFKDQLDGSIKTTSSSGNESKYLNTLCGEIYKAGKDKVDENGSTDDKYKEADVWKYCSGLGGKPKTVEEVDSGKYQDSNKTLIGKETTDRQKLVSVTGNNKFWEIRDKEFKNEDNHEKINGGTKDDFFDIGKGKTIKELCGLAYQSEATTETNSQKDKPTKAKVLKHCSLDKE